MIQSEQPNAHSSIDIAKKLAGAAVYCNSHKADKTPLQTHHDIDNWPWIRVGNGEMLAYAWHISDSPIIALATIRGLCPLYRGSPITWNITNELYNGPKAIYICTGRVQVEDAQND